MPQTGNPAHFGFQTDTHRVWLTGEATSTPAAAAASLMAASRFSAYGSVSACGRHGNSRRFSGSFVRSRCRAEPLTYKGSARCACRDCS